IACAQIGQDHRVKLELGENYWDELGNGTYSRIHTVMFDSLLEELGVTDGQSKMELLNGVTWESLACGNALLITALHRRHACKAPGALGALEMPSPLRFRKLIRGFERIGLSQRARQYHTLHIQIDARHGHGWLHNAIAPTVEANPEAARE